jgi:hypothetical protein
MEYKEGYVNSFPPQKLSSKNKTIEWAKQNINAAINMSSDNGKFGRTTKLEKQELYDLVNGIFNKDRFKFLTNPTNIKDGEMAEFGGMPTILRLHNIIRPKIELLKGEEAKRPFSWVVLGDSGEIINDRIRAKQEDILSALQAMIRGEQVELSEIDKKHKVLGSDLRERNTAKIIERVWKDQNLKQKFSKGFYHATAVAEEIYYVSKHKGKPIVRVVNPLYFDFDKNPDLDAIEDGNWAREEREMSVASIVDEYDLTEQQISDLDSGKALADMNPMNLPGGYLNQVTLETNYDNSGNPLGQEWINYGKPGSYGDINTPTSTYSSRKYKVNTVVWVSLRKIFFLNYIDEDGVQQTKVIEDDTFKLTPQQKAMGWTLDVEWIKDIWKGTRIGANIFTDVGPLENQTGKLPYVGYIYNNINSRSQSLVQMVEAHQYTYMEIWYKLMMELAKAKGKKIILDSAQMPSEMDASKWLYYYDILGIVWINSMEEGREGDPTSRSTFAHHQMLDQSITSSVNNYILMLDKVERMIGDVLGVSAQREGSISSNETVGGVERSVNQSSLITEPFFIQHNEVKKNVLQQVLEVSQLCLLEENSPLQLMVDDAYRELVMVDAEKINDSSYKIHVSDSSEDYAMVEKLKSLAQVALQTESTSLSSLAKLYKSRSASEIISEFKRWEDEKSQRDQAMQEAQQKLEQDRLAAEENKSKEELAYKINKDALDRARDIQVASINAMRSKDGPTDVNMNGILDPIEVSKLALEEQKMGTQNLLDQMKLEMESQDKQVKNKMEESKRDLEYAKLNIENKKIDVEAAKFTREQDQQDAKNIADSKDKEKDRKLKEKEMANKEKLERLKIKNKPKPTKPKK